MDTLSTEEFYAISRGLEKHHVLFYKMWEMGKPVFVTDADTAYVKFNKEGEYTFFGINRPFWEKLSPRTKEFIICHECLHVALNHGIRGIESLTDPMMADITNMSMDLAVNHLLVNKFGFKREEIDGCKNYCWIDTVFKGNKTVKTDENFEYYYNMLKTQKKEVITICLTVDNHGMSMGPDNGLNDLLGKMNDVLSNEEKGSLKDMIEKHFEKESSNNKTAGTTSGNSWVFAGVSKDEIVKKKKWETIIKNWSKKYVKISSKDHEQWVRLNRRFALFNDHDLFIPSEMEIDEFEEEKGKLLVHFFLDTSGSCQHLAKRFFKAALSLPDSRFDTRLFCFDTKVYKVDKETQKLYGFGGTSFECIEDYIQAHLKDNNNKYPEAVFVVTDGFGDDVNPQYPKRWYWFLSVDCIDCIPKDSHTYDLSKFE